jgi:hypothetical protein
LTRLARPHRAVERLHKAAVDVAMVGRVDGRGVLLMRVLGVGGGNVNDADRQLTRLVHEATELSCGLVHVAGGRLGDPVAIGRLGRHEVRVYGDVGTDATGATLHLGTAAPGVEGLPVEALGRVGLRERGHARARRGPRGRAPGGRATGAARRRHRVHVVVVLCVAEGYLGRRRELPRGLGRRHRVGYRRWGSQVHRLGRRRRHHLEAVGQLLELSEAAGVATLVVGRGRGGMRVRHWRRLYVEVGRGRAGRVRARATGPVLDDVGVLAGEGHGLRDSHVVAALGDDGHVV